jgi:cytochrome b subunit of formate dehydrogenase
MGATDNVRRLDQIRLNIDGTPAAFIISYLTFFGENKYCLSLATALAKPDLVYHADVCWQFQKNGVIKQKKSFPRVGQYNSLQRLCLASSHRSTGCAKTQCQPSPRGLH